MFNEKQNKHYKLKKYENTLLINNLNLNKNLHKANFCILKSVEYNLNNNLSILVMKIIVMRQKFS